jgi:hypothetical protein
MVYFSNMYADSVMAKNWKQANQWRSVHGDISIAEMMANTDQNGTSIHLDKVVRISCSNQNGTHTPEV